MPIVAISPLRTVSLAGVILLAGIAAAPAQEKVGVNAAVNPQATGTPPGGSARQLVIGQEVVFNEHITTAAAGQTQLVFLDQSAMSVGPNSDLTIDQFVYDPNTGNGKMAISAARGVLRYVGGKLSKQEDAVTVRTPAGTIAVRGGAFLADIDPAGRLTVYFIYGKAVAVTGVNGITETLRRPGYAITVSERGAAPSAPYAAPPGALLLLTTQLDGRAGGSGGIASPPSESTVALSPVPPVVSGNFAVSVEQASQPFNNPYYVPPTDLTSANLQEVLQISTVQNQGSPIIQQAAKGQTPSTPTPSSPPSPPSPSSPSPPSPQTVSIAYAGVAKNTNGNGTARGFVDQSANAVVPFTGATQTYPTGQPQQGVITVPGPSGTTSFPLPPGPNTYGPQGTSSPSGTFAGTSYLSPDSTFFYASQTPTGLPTERGFIFGGQPVSASFLQPTGSNQITAFAVQPDAALQSNIPFIRNQAGGNLSNASISPLYMVTAPSTAFGDSTTVAAARTLQASIAISGQAANQQSVIAIGTGTADTLQSSGQPIINGQLRGSSLLSSTAAPVRLSSAISSVADGAGNSIYGSSAISGFVLDQTAYNATGTGSGVVTTPIIPSTAAEQPLSGSATTYGFTQAVIPTSLPAGTGSSRTTQALSGNFGGLMTTTAQSTPYSVTGGVALTTDAPTNRVQAIFSGTAQSPSNAVNSLTMQYGGLSGNAGGRQAFVDDRTFAALESQTSPQQINGQNLVVNGNPNQAASLYLVSSATAPAPTSLLPAGASYCQCQFLQWGYWGGDLLTGNATDSTISRIDRGHINFWAAGLPTPLSDINALAGQAITANYTGHAIGSVFNNGLSYAAAGGFNGSYNFATQNGTLAITNFDGRNFTATGRAPLSGTSYTFGLTSPGVAGTLNGAFYGPMAANTGGSFSVRSTVGPNYLASGIYAGSR